MSKFHLNLTPASVTSGRIAGKGYGHFLGYFLVLAMVAFSLFGNQSKLIVEEHEGADHGQLVSDETSHEDSHHDGGHHDDHHDSDEPDDSEQPIHHHHVEVSPALAIAAVTPGDLSIFQPITSLPKQFADEICPPSPAREIVKPPQVA